MRARAKRRQDAEAPVADLVAEPLDDDRAVGRHRARRGRLLVQECEQVARSTRVEPMLVAKPRQRLLLRQGDELARRLADRLSELVRTADTLALPERDGARNAGSM